MTAGLDLVYDPMAPAGRKVAVQGLALVFGIFPASFSEFLDLARSRLKLGKEEPRAELQQLLAARIQVLWAWMPGLQCDIYAEVDHATDSVTVWKIGPTAGSCTPVDLATAGADLDAAFLEGLVLNGTRHWGGAAGLARLVRRFGRQSLLVAAQVAELMERGEAEDETLLTVAQSRWGDLDGGNESAWEALADHEHPWACAQLGRLALRLGLVRAARRLLDRVRLVQAGPAVWADLAEACDRVDDLPGATEAAAQVVSLSSDEPALRRLVILQARLGQQGESGETLVRHRASGGSDTALVEAGLRVLERPALPLVQRAHLSAWLGARTVSAFAASVPLADLRQRVARPGLDEALAGLRAALSEILAGGGEATAMAERIVLLALPLIAVAPTGDVGSLAAHALLALRGWAEQAFGTGRIPDSLAVRKALLDVARTV